MEYVDLLLAAMLGAFVGYRVANHLNQIVINDLLQRVGITPEKMEQVLHDLKKEMTQGEADAAEAEFPSLEIKLEQHGDVMYAYRKDSGLFLAQGKTRDELIAMIGEKITNVTLVISEADGAGLIKENPTS